MEQLISIADVVEITTLSRSTVKRMLDSGALPSIKIGHRRMVKSSVLEHLVDSGSVITIKARAGVSQ